MKNICDCGLNIGRLALLVDTIKKDIETEQYDGGVILVARHGIVGLHEAIGYADREANRLCRLDDIFWLMSISKTFIDVVLLKKIERGDVALTTRVMEVIPEFKGGFKDQVTVFNLLTHTAGAPQEAFPSGLELGGEQEKAVAAACRMELVSPPGLKIDYSPLWAHTLLSEIIRRVDGGKRLLSTIYKDELFDPLQMKDTSLGRRPELASRMVPLVFCSSSNEPSPMSPAAINKNSEVPRCCVATVHDMFRFAEMLRRGGELDGVRILSPTTIKLAMTNHTKNMANETLVYTMFAGHGWQPFPISLGLDFIVRGDGSGFPCAMGSLTSPRTYGKFGTGSVGFWIDPEYDVTFIFFAVGLLHEYHNIFRFQRLADMATSAVI